MAKLRVQNLRKSFDGQATAVHDVSFDLGDRETLTVLGPSGCGKSTLLRLIAGLERPSAGDIVIDGERVTDREPRDRDVAMVFQSYALYPHLTVFQNIAMALRLRRVARDEVKTRVKVAADRLGLSGLLHRRPRALSGGERQRVALARAIVRSPKLFLLDEPLSNLDALLREHARSELKSLFAQLGATVVYVTHDQTEAMTLSSRVAVMRAGRFEQLGTPDEIYNQPGTAFVAGFVGSPSMNLLPGDLLGDRAHTIGIRPEDLRIDEAGPLSLTVALSEVLGAQRLLTLEHGRLRLRILVPARDPTEWSDRTVRVAVDPAKLHRFDHEGRRYR